MDRNGTKPTMIAMVRCPETRARLQEVANHRGISVVTASDPVVLRATVDAVTPHIVFVEIVPPACVELLVIKDLCDRDPSSSVVALGREPGERAALDAMKAGALDYVPTPATSDELEQAVGTALEAVAGSGAAPLAVERMDCTLVCVPDPMLVESTVDWVMQNTRRYVPAGRQTHLRAALHELLLNAVEHGSLEIYYQEKREALARGTYEELVAARRRDPRFGERRVTVHWAYDKPASRLCYSVMDQGKGFKWKSLLGRSQEPPSPGEANGRGLFLVQGLFPDLMYNERGNEVTLTLPLS